VDDLIDGLIKLMDTGADITGPINLGNPVEFTMRDLADQSLPKPDRHHRSSICRCRQTIQSRQNHPLYLRTGRKRF